MFNMYFSKKNYPPVSEDIKRYIKENNTKIFNNHQLQASKMKINHIFENEKPLNLKINFKSSKGENKNNEMFKRVISQNQINSE